MNCSKAIKLLPAYLDRELRHHETSALERHLEACPFCSAELAGLRAASKMLDAWEGMSPRRSYVSSVISQIAAEERGVTQRSRIGAKLLELRWISKTLRVAAAMVFLIGVALFPGHAPIREEADRISLGRVDSVHPADALIPFDEDLLHSYIKPSELGLVLRGMENRASVIKAASGGITVPPVRDGDSFPGSMFPEVNHIYFPEEGMPVESVIPLEIP